MHKFYLKITCSIILVLMGIQYSFSCSLVAYTLTRDTISAGVVVNTYEFDSEPMMNNRMDTVYRADMMTELYHEFDTNQIVFRGIIDSVVDLNTDPGSYSINEDIYISIIELYKGSLISDSIVLRRHLLAMNSCDESYSMAVNIEFLNFSNKLDSIDDLDIHVYSFGFYGYVYKNEELHAEYEPFWTTPEEIQGYTSIKPMVQPFASDKKNMFISNKHRGLYLMRNKKGYDLKGRVNQISIPLLLK